MCPRCHLAIATALVGFLVAAAISAVAMPAAAARYTWRVEIVDGTGNAGRHSSLAIAPNGTVYVLYHDDDESVLRLATFFQLAWSFEEVAGPGFFTGDTSLALDVQGDLHASYFDANAGTVRYGTRAAAGGSWNFTDVDFGYIDGYNRMALDPLGSPDIAYTTYSDTLRYAHLSGSSWVREDVDPSTLGAAYESLAIDSNGAPHIAYYGNGQLRYASKPSASWAAEVVDPGDYAGQFAALGLDSRGQPDIAYYDTRGQSLRYATRSPSGWSLSVIDAAGNPGLGIALAVGPDDRPRVAYYAESLGELRYAELENGTWGVQTVDDETTVGWEPSLALDPAGVPHVSYYDFTRGALRHAVGLSILGARTVGTSEVTETGAILHGEVTSLDGYAAANVSFEWRLAGESLWRNTTPASVTTADPFQAYLVDLAPGGRYEFRAVVEAGGVTETGRVVAFSTRIPAAIDLLPILLYSATIGVAVVGLSLAAIAWFRGPISLKRRGGKRRDGPA